MVGSNLCARHQRRVTLLTIEHCRESLHSTQLSQDGIVQQSALPFDAPAAHEMSLFRLLTEVSRRLNEIGLITVQGEVHRPREDKAGNRYFTLRDRNAQISVVVPSQRKQFAHGGDGTRVAATGRLEFRNEHGQAMLRATEVVPVGEGAVTQLIAEVRGRLFAEGLLDRARRPLPLLPAGIGVVCGKDAAVRRDIESVRSVRFPNYPMVFAEVTVGGPGAPESIMRGIDFLVSLGTVEVIVLARGGGDATQLLAFSDEMLCRHIAACPLPVISAIGHEEDRPLSDAVADLRAGTPSIAAALVVPSERELRQRIRSTVETCEQSMVRRNEQANARVRAVEWRSAIERRAGRAGSQLGAIDWYRSVDRSLGRAQMRLATTGWRDRVPTRVAANAQHLAALARQVELLAPQRILERGYAVVRRADGSVVRDPSVLSLAESLEVTVAAGMFTVRAAGSNSEPADANNVRDAIHTADADD